MDVHHVPRLAVPHRDVIPQRRIEVQVIDRVLCREGRRGQIAMAFGDEDFQVRLSGHPQSSSN